MLFRHLRLAGQEGGLLYGAGLAGHICGQVVAREEAVTAPDRLVDERGQFVRIAEALGDGGTEGDVYPPLLADDAGDYALDVLELALLIAAVDRLLVELRALALSVGSTS